MPLHSTYKVFCIEFTIVRLRYSLEGDRPSQTTSFAKFSSLLLNTALLEEKDGISFKPPVSTCAEVS
jgi:hypothetical protein